MSAAAVSAKPCIVCGVDLGELPVVACTTHDQKEIAKAMMVRTSGEVNVVSKAEFDALTKINGEGSENSGEGCDGLRGKPEAEQTVAGASPALSTTHYSTTREEFRAAVARDPGAVFTPIAEDATQSSESDPDAFKVKAAL